MESTCCEIFSWWSINFSLAVVLTSFRVHFTSIAYLMSMQFFLAWISKEAKRIEPLSLKSSLGSLFYI